MQLLWSVAIIPPNNPVRSLAGINPGLHFGKQTLKAHYPCLGSQSLYQRLHTVLISFEVITEHWTGGSSGEEGLIVADNAGVTSIVARKAGRPAAGGGETASSHLWSRKQRACHSSGFLPPPPAPPPCSQSGTSAHGMVPATFRAVCPP